MSTTSRIDRRRAEQLARERDACYRQRREQLRREAEAREERIRAAELCLDDQNSVKS